MTDDALKSLFLKSVDQYERSMRWCYVGLFLLVIFQLMIFGPFIQAHCDFVNSESIKKRVSGAMDFLMKVQSRLEVTSKDMPTPEKLEMKIDVKLNKRS